MKIKKSLLDKTDINVDQAITIPIERYNELIKKEVIYDEIDKKYDKSVFLLSKPMYV